MSRENKDVLWALGLGVPAADGSASQIKDIREASGRQEEEKIGGPLWAHFPPTHTQPGLAARGSHAWCLAPLVHSKGESLGGDSEKDGAIL